LENIKPDTVPSELFVPNRKPGLQSNETGSKPEALIEREKATENVQHRLQPLQEIQVNEAMHLPSNAVGPSDSPEDPLNNVLASDDLNYSQRETEEAQSTQHSTERLCENAAEKKGDYDFELVPADLIRVFDNITQFQIGQLKPPADTVRGRAAFVPFFPFMYDLMENGDIIMDREQFISLHVKPVTRKKTQ